jgi:hypothetical protein
LTRRRVGFGLAVVGVLLLGAGTAIVVARDDPAEPAGPAGAAGLPGFGAVAVRIEPASGPARRTCMAAARTEAQRRRGLMEVTDPELGGLDGMVFVYAEDETGGFWMRNTPLPLSIAYLDAGGRLVSATGMAPCGDSPDCPLYPAGGPYRYAVEVPRGGLDDLGITRGARVRVGGDC